MATVAVTPPFPFFTGRSGEPLDAGYIYIGLVSQDPVANPIAIFWDSALSIPAPNPVRTSAGYLSRNGAPGTLFAAADYSMRVADKGNTLLYVIPSSARVGLGDITLSAGEKLIAESGSTIDVRDGAAVRLGNNTGVAVAIEIENARFNGNIIPGTKPFPSLGSETRLWEAWLGQVRVDNVIVPTVAALPGGSTAVGVLSTPFGLAVAKKMQTNDMTSYRKAQVASNVDYAGLAALNARTTVLALARQTGTSPAVLQASEAYNVSGITTSAASQPYVVTFIAPVPANAFAFVTSNGASQSIAGRAVIAGDGLTVTVTLFSSADLIVSTTFSLVVYGAPSATGVAGVVSLIT